MKPSRKYTLIHKLLHDDGAWLYYTEMISLQAEFAVDILKCQLELDPPRFT